MSKTRYVPDKDKECEYCLYWEGRKKGCKLGQNNCPFTPQDFEESRDKSQCNGCPYVKPGSCIGFCLKVII